MIKALHYLHTQLSVIHRDVKPSNILISRSGKCKICDFGISGYLVDSVAKTIEAGCKPYMAVSSAFEKAPLARSQMEFFILPRSPSASTPAGTPPSTTSGPTCGPSA